MTLLTFLGLLIGCVWLMVRRYQSRRRKTQLYREGYRDRNGHCIPMKPTDKDIRQLLDLEEWLKLPHRTRTEDDI